MAMQPGAAELVTAASAPELRSVAAAAQRAVRELGGGLREHVYQRAMAHLLRGAAGFSVITEVDVAYRLEDGTVVGSGRADLVFGESVVEVKVGRLACREQYARQARQYRRFLGLSGPVAVVIFSDVADECRVYGV
jgi:hypothetical protein